MSDDETVLTGKTDYVSDSDLTGSENESKKPLFYPQFDKKNKKNKKSTKKDSSNKHSNSVITLNTYRRLKKKYKEESYPFSKLLAEVTKDPNEKINFIKQKKNYEELNSINNILSFIVIAHGLRFFRFLIDNPGVLVSSIIVSKSGTVFHLSSEMAISIVEQIAAYLQERKEYDNYEILDCNDQSNILGIIETTENRINPEKAIEISDIRQGKNLGVRRIPKKFGFVTTGQKKRLCNPAFNLLDEPMYDKQYKIGDDDKARGIIVSNKFIGKNIGNFLYELSQSTSISLHDLILELSSNSNYSSNGTRIVDMYGQEYLILNLTELENEKPYKKPLNIVIFSDKTCVVLSELSITPNAIDISELNFNDRDFTYDLYYYPFMNLNTCALLKYFMGIMDQTGDTVEHLSMTKHILCSKYNKTCIDMNDDMINKINKSTLMLISLKLNTRANEIVDFSCDTDSPDYHDIMKEAVSVHSQNPEGSELKINGINVRRGGYRKRKTQKKRKRKTNKKRKPRKFISKNYNYK